MINNMKYSFVLKYIIGGAVVAFLLQYLFNEKDITYWMIVCLMIAVMVSIHMFVRVFFYYQRKIGKTNISCEFPFHRREYIAL